MKKLYLGLLGAFLAILLVLGLISVLDKDQTISQVENRKLAAKPTFSWVALTDGSYIRDLEAYYADTFPFRDSLLKLNKTLNKFYYYSGGDNSLIISGASGAEQGGENLDDVQNALDGKEQGMKPDETTPDTTTPVAPEEPTAPEQPVNPDLNVPEEGQATKTNSTIIIVGDNAMDIPTATFEVIDTYAQAVTNLATKMGSNVRTFSLVTPNSGEFYSPESFHTGQHSQKDMIDYCYKAMGDNVLTVDAYSALRQHADEYIYFRTDHHWTARGAYYAYTKFCETAGLEPVALDKFETGQYEDFLGTMYSWTSSYPQSDALKKNPDTVEYFRPLVETHAKYYQDATLTNGVTTAVIANVGASVDNKYLTFIGGDTPICVIETATTGPVAMVVKESYGNAFVPFLTSHYSKIIVVDPREFNKDGKPSLNLPEFAKQQGVNDLVVINYPFMINNSYFVKMLNKLAP